MVLSNQIVNCIILCGGSGTRLWPLSREKLPKQFLPLANKNTMLQNTINRLHMLSIQNSDVQVGKFIFVCNEEHGFIVEQQYTDLQKTIPQLSNVPYQIITEPKGRDTAPAIAISTLICDPSELSIVVPSDHIFNDKDFVNLIVSKIQTYTDSITLFGIRPTYPSTAYGYIESSGLRGNDRVNSFVEKPNKNVALELMKTAKHYWNAGVFLFKNQVMIDCYKQYAPSILEQCKTTLDASIKSDNTIKLNKECFDQCQAISVDYAIMEKVCQNKDGIPMFVYAYSGTWCDVGSFHALHEHLLNNPSDDVNISGTNVHHGNNIITKDSKECYVYSDKLTAIMGMSNLVVVNMPDALLICDKSDTQQIKELVKEFKSSQQEEAFLHSKVYRPWGWYTNIDGNDHSGTKIKRLVVLPGKRLSLQSHKKREEHWIVVRGKACVQKGDDKLDLVKNDYVHIPINMLHRVENTGDDLLEIVETQVGEYLGEDDIVRYQDDFGRV